MVVRPAAMAAQPRHFQRLLALLDPLLGGASFHLHRWLACVLPDARKESAVLPILQVLKKNVRLASVFPSPPGAVAKGWSPKALLPGGRSPKSRVVRFLGEEIRESFFVITQSVKGGNLAGSPLLVAC